jgi:vacuolar-type H+-ATPase subunit C/Vma6
MDADKRQEIPEKFETLKEAGEFWDTHSAADYWDEMEDVEIEFDIKNRYYLVPVHEELYQRLKAYAAQHDQSVEEVVNHFLEKALDRMYAA